MHFNDAVGGAQPVKIEKQAFGNCPKLEEITFPPTGAYNEIDKEAFYSYGECCNLKRIYNAPSSWNWAGISTVPVLRRFPLQKDLHMSMEFSTIVAYEWNEDGKIPRSGRGRNN